MPPPLVFLNEVPCLSFSVIHEDNDAPVMRSPDNFVFASFAQFSSNIVTHLNLHYACTCEREKWTLVQAVYVAQLANNIIYVY